MHVTFTYSQEKDIWCLLNYGKTSNNSANPTKEYLELLAFAGEDPSNDDVKKFLESYLSTHNITVESYISEHQREWEKVADVYRVTAERVFGVSLPKDVIAYLSVNSRCPYNVREGYFLVGMPSYSATKTAMHELWHFYTWYKFGVVWEDILGKEKYNEIKEALTVLLNVECRDILPTGVVDKGYPQHQVLREKILKLWEESKNIETVWVNLTEQSDVH